jgi:ankyrin repeat protein
LSSTKIRKKLNTLSSGLDAAYGDAIKRIESQLPEQSQTAKEVLTWIVGATRPLTPLELRHALAIEIGEFSLDEENIPDINDLISICAGLVTIDEESNAIRLAHYTTQEYLEQKWTSVFPGAHSLLGSACITYLNYDAFQSGVAPSTYEFHRRLEEYPLFAYSALNWDVHIRTHDDHLDLILELLRDDGKVAACAQILLNERDPLVASQRMVREIKGLHLSVYLELYEAAKILVMEGMQVDSHDGIQRTPLSWMAEIGSHRAVDFLLSEGANPNCVDIHGQTALSYAVLQGHEEVFQVLKARGAHMQSKDKEGRTPLFYAIWGGHESMVKLLLDEGSEANCEDDGKQTPLFHAIQHTFEGRFDTNKRVKIVELLLSKDVDLTHKDKTGQVPLSYAVQRGNKILVRLLLEAGADIEFQNDRGETALSDAVARGHEDVVKLLLEWHANPRCKDYDGQTPLSASARRGNESMVRILLEGGANPNDTDELFGKSALSYAAWSGHVSILNILLERCADPNCKDKQGRTPLSWAAEYGHLPVVASLLEQGIDMIFEEDMCRKNPLEHAASNDHDEVVDLLSSMVCVAQDCKSKDIERARESQSMIKSFTIEV